MTSFRHHVVFVLSIAVLFAAVGRLLLLNRAELSELASLRVQERTVPPYGSFHGIGKGASVTGNNPGRPGARLLFALRSSQLERDRDYWNEVVRQTMQGETPVYYWGVCDSAKACDASQERALFTVVEYLDPFEMRAVATGTADGSALLYDAQDALLQVVTPDQDPAVTARLINELVY